MVFINLFEKILFCQFGSNSTSLYNCHLALLEMENNVDCLVDCFFDMKLNYSLVSGDIYLFFIILCNFPTEHLEQSFFSG